MSGSVSSLDRLSRVLIPQLVRDEVEWWLSDGGRAMAEIVEPGLVRLHELQLASAAVVGLSAALDALSDSDRAVAEAALVDRYRPLRFYSDGRVTLTAEVAVMFRPRADEQLAVFVQRTGCSIEIMSLSFRASRLASFPALQLSPK